jgi:hypothetical protein
MTHPRGGDRQRPSRRTCRQPQVKLTLTRRQALPRHGLQQLHLSAAVGRWVGLGYDDKFMTGWGSMAKTAEEAEAVIERLNQASGQVART